MSFFSIFKDHLSDIFSVTPQTLPSSNALICSAVNNSLKTIHFLLLSCTSVSHGLFSILWTS
ncbi:MAG: hypothetical protein WCG25_06085 [bacterium]